MTLAHSWIFMLLAPFLAAALMMKRHANPACWYVAATLSVLPALLLAITAPPSFLPNWLWPGSQLGVTQAGRGWLGFTALLWGLAAIYAVATEPPTQRHGKRFWLFWMTACSGNLLLIISQDAISFYVGFSMMSLAAYALVVHDGSPAARRAGRLYLQLAVLGEMLLLAGILVQMQYADSSQFTTWQANGMSAWAAGLLIGGLGLKAGFWPLHVWLPLAHPAAPAAASAVLSGAMIKAGILGMWVFLPASEQLAIWSPWLMTVGLISALYGVAAGITRSNSKQALAYSSISQMGYLVFITALGWQLPDEQMLVGSALLVYATHHAFAKGALFLGADLMKRYRLPGGRQRWWLLALLTLPALALSGLPATSGAAAKSGLKALLETPELALWAVWLQLGALATSLLMVRIVWLFVRDQKQAVAVLPTMPQALAQTGPWVILCLMALATAWLWPTMQASMRYSLIIPNLFDALWPVVAALLVALAALRWQWRVPGALYDTSHPFEGWSVRFRRRLNRPFLPEVGNLWPATADQRLRRIERYWNRLWQGHSVNRSAALMILFMLIAAVLILL